MSPSNPCQTCQPATTPYAWSSLPEGTSCGTAEICNVGNCVSGCFIGEWGYPPETVNPNNACQTCQPGTSTTAWTNVANGVSCDTGDVCNGGSCVAGINALSFSGTGQVTIPNSTALNLGTAATVEAWFYVVSFGGEMILDKWTNGAEDKFLGFADATQEPPSCWFWYPGEPAQGSDGEGASATPTAQAWHHIATTLGNGTLTIFVDGVATGSGAYGASIANSTGPLNIGGLTRDGSWHPPINGYIGEVRISSTNKYPSNFTPAVTLTVQSDTLALWHLNEGTGTVANDSGPNGLTGSIHGTTQWVLAPPRP